MEAITDQQQTKQPIHNHPVNRVELGSRWKVDNWGIETSGEAERICGIKWADQTAPRAAVQSSHGLSHELLYNVTVCVSAWETILGTKCWQTSVAMLVKVPLLRGGRRQCQRVQSGGANSRDDAKFWFDQVFYKIWKTTSNISTW